MVASIISRIIGLIYRRPLGAVLGTVGLGYYGYASNLYSILLLISSYSIPMGCIQGWYRSGWHCGSIKMPGRCSGAR